MDQAKTFLSGKGGAVQAALATEMEAAAETLEFERAAAIRELSLTYGLLFDLDRMHRGLVRIVDPSHPAGTSAVLGPDDRSVQVESGEPAPGSASMRRFLGEGVHHIATGYDHLLFILVLLLPTVVTRGPDGAHAMAGGEHAQVPAEPIARVVDTTGAGDSFAAGFLMGQVRGRSLADCLTMGAICAAEVISHYGARPEADLGALVAARLG